MRTVTAVFVVLAVWVSSACVRERETPKTETPPPQMRAIKPAPMADHDLSGRKRAKPPTMGALEAEPTPPPLLPPKKPPRKKAAAAQ